MRIQRKRTSGWRMPENAVYVGRPTKWGNPYKIGDICSGIGIMDRDAVLRMYSSWLAKKLRDDPHFLDPLKDKDLACWCPLNKPCHADIIIKFMELKEGKLLF